MSENSSVQNTRKKSVLALSGGACLTLFFVFASIVTPRFYYPLLLCFLATFFWGRKATPVTPELGTLSRFVFGSALMFGILGCLYDGMLGLMSGFASFVYVFLFVKRIFSLKNEDNIWADRLAKGKQMTSISQEDFDSMTVEEEEKLDLI